MSKSRTKDSPRQRRRQQEAQRKRKVAYNSDWLWDEAPEPDETWEESYELAQDWSDDTGDEESPVATLAKGLN